MTDAATGSTTTTTEKTFTQKDIDIERAHAQAAKLEADELRTKFKDIDPEVARNAITEAAKLKREAAKTPEEIAALETAAREDERKKIGGKLTEYEQREAQKDGELNRLRVVNPAMLKAAELFNSSELELVQMLVERDCIWHEGQIVVKGPDGKPAQAADPRNGVKKLEEYYGELAVKYPNLAKPSISPGGKTAGSKSPTNTTGELSMEKYIAMTPEQRQALPADVRAKMSSAYFKKG